MTDVEVLERVKKEISMKEESFTVLYYDERHMRGERYDEAADSWCKSQGWRYLPPTKFLGCEDSCLVVFGGCGSILLEAWSRAKNFLVVVTRTEDRCMIII